MKFKLPIIICIILLLILQSGCTQTLRTQFPEPNFPQKSATIVGLSRIQTQSVGIQTQSVLPEPPARRSKIYYFLGTFISSFFGKIPLLLSMCTTRSVRVGRGFDSPVHCRSAGLSVEFEKVSSEFVARTVSRAQFSQKSATILGPSQVQTQSVLLEPPARRSKIYYFFGDFCFAFPLY